MFVWILGGKKSLIHHSIYVLKPNKVVVNIADNRKFKNTHLMDFLKKANAISYLVKPSLGRYCNRALESTC